MHKLFLIMFFLPMASLAQKAVDSLPAKVILTEKKLNIPVDLNVNGPVENKYIFTPIFTKNNTGKLAGKRDGVIRSFYSQSSGNLQYNLTLEAQDFINTYRRKNGSGLLSMKNWGAFYLSSMERILIQYGIPKQLVYLAVIETDLDVNSVSWCGATGMWQFMPETGRMYGLYVRNGIDERYDWYKSTIAAAKYLQDLYTDFKDWLLVVAAYNGGPGRVHSAIRRSGSRNFWDLQYYLPTESSNHVKKFIATQYIMEGSTGIASVGGFADMPKKFFNPLEKGTVAVDTTNNKMKSQTISGRYNSLVLSKYILMDIITFNLLNPDFDNQIAKNTSMYNLRLPEDKMQLFRTNQLQIMNESLQLFLTLNGIQQNDAPLINTPVKKKGKKS